MSEWNMLRACINEIEACTDTCTENQQEYMQAQDLILRQAAIDAMNEVYCHIEMIKKRPVNKAEQAIYRDMIGAVKSVPSAQPECPEQPESAKEYCAECDHIEMCKWYPYEGCEFRSR